MVIGIGAIQLVMQKLMMVAGLTPQAVGVTGAGPIVTAYRIFCISITMNFR